MTIKMLDNSNNCMLDSTLFILIRSTKQQTAAYCKIYLWICSYKLFLGNDFLASENGNINRTK